jgi:hypothetical protein
MGEHLGIIGFVDERMNYAVIESFNGDKLMAINEELRNLGDIKPGMRVAFKLNPGHSLVYNIRMMDEVNQSRQRE